MTADTASSNVSSSEPSPNNGRANPSSAHHAAWTLFAVCTAALILPLSFSGGAIATPAIGRDLGGSPLALSWITNAFMLSFGSLLMAAGTLADRYGRKRLFMSGVAVFVLMSLALDLASNVMWFDVLRGVQGMGAAAALAGGSASLAQAFDGRARMRAFSLLGTSFGIGLAFGPILAGTLIEHVGWRAVFLSGAVIGTLALLPAAWRMRESRDPAAHALDWGGTLSFSGALALFTWGVLQAAGDGWHHPRVLKLLLGAAVFLVAFVIIERRVARPMLDLSLFRYPRFVGVQLLPVATCYCFVVLLVLLPLRFIGIEGRSEIAAGLAMMALSAPMLVVPSIAAALTRYASAGLLSGIGFLIATLGLFLLSRVAPGAAAHKAILPMLVIGIGTGLPWGLMDGLSVSVVPTDRAGMATGIFGTTRVAGEGIALAIVSALLAGLIDWRLTAAGTLHAAGTLAGDMQGQAARYLASGDLTHALAALPGVPSSALLAVYGDAFTWLLYVLMAITLVSALFVFGFLCEWRSNAQALAAS